MVGRGGKERPDVLFQLAQQSVFLRKTGISYVFSDQSQVQSRINTKVKKNLDVDDIYSEMNEMKAQAELWKHSKTRVHQVDMNFLNANEDPTIGKLGKSIGYTNYYYPHCTEGILKVGEYQTIQYHSVYDGIDLVFLSPCANGLKYDLIVRPFADPNQIELEWRGADSAFVTDNGELIIENQILAIHESIPKVYQIIQNDTIYINAAYHLETSKKGSTIVSFELSEYNPNFSLIIDPWVTNFGGDGVDYGLEVDTDPDGNVVMSGESGSSTAISEAGFQMVFGGGESDSFLAPNIFTPDNDGVNNMFYFPSEEIADFNCSVTNRWGVEVFQFLSVEDKWDGTAVGNGKECPAGVYFYIYAGTDINGQTFQGHGTVQLVRD